MPDFLLKDLTLLGAALWSAGEALAAERDRGSPVSYYKTA